MLDGKGREVSPAAASLIAWAEAWITAQVETGVPFEDARRRFNQAMPLVVSYADAVSAAAQADTMLERAQ